MPVTAAHVEATVQSYLPTGPDKRDHLASLLEMLAAGAKLTGRQVLGHATIFGVAVRPDGRVAQI